MGGPRSQLTRPAQEGQWWKELRPGEGCRRYGKPDRSACSCCQRAGAALPSHPQSWRPRRCSAGRSVLVLLARNPAAADQDAQQAAVRDVARVHEPSDAVTAAKFRGRRPAKRQQPAPGIEAVLHDAVDAWKQAGLSKVMPALALGASEVPRWTAWSKLAIASSRAKFMPSSWSTSDGDRCRRL